MSKGLSTLIRLKKRELDELRRQMGLMEQQKQQFLGALSKNQTELESEMQLAGKTPEMTQFFGSFAKRIQARREQIEHEIKVLNAKMETLRGHIAEAFAEQKKFEIALEQLKLRQREALARKETMELDEIASSQHERKKEMK